MGVLLEAEDDYCRVTWVGEDDQEQNAAYPILAPKTVICAFYNERGVMLDPVEIQPFHEDGIRLQWNDSAATFKLFFLDEEYRPCRAPIQGNVGEPQPEEPVTVEDDMFYRPLASSSGEEYLIGAFDTPVTAEALFEVLGNSLAFSLYTGEVPLYVYENGAFYDPDSAEISEQGYFTLRQDSGANRYNESLKYSGRSDISVLRRDNKDVLAHTGNGVETKVYAIKTPSGRIQEVRITIVHSYLAQVDRVRTSWGSSLVLPVDYTTYNTHQRSFSDKTIDSTAFTEGDYVLFSYSFRNAHSEKFPGIQEETVRKATVYHSKFSSYQSVVANYKRWYTVVVDGKTLYPALDDAIISYNWIRARDIDRSCASDDDYTIFTDGAGHIICADVDIPARIMRHFVYVTEFGSSMEENYSSETSALTAVGYDAQGNREILNVDTSTKHLDDYGNVIHTVYTSLNGEAYKNDVLTGSDDGWESAVARQDERNYLAHLNGASDVTLNNGVTYTKEQSDARGLYYRTTSSDGKTILMDLETYAKERVWDANRGTGVRAIGENDAAAQSVYRGVAGLRIISSSSLSTALNTNVAPTGNVRLYADNRTAFFYIGFKDGSTMPDKGQVPEAYVGISNASTADEEAEGSIAWYAENSDADVAYAAQVVLVVDGKSE